MRNECCRQTDGRTDFITASAALHYVVQLKKLAHDMFMDRVSNRISTREYAVHTEVAVSREMSEGTSQGRGMYYTCQQVRLADSNVV